jgi:pyrroloquinoline quinone biosynthesis protein D
MAESTSLVLDDVPVMPPRFRLQWEPAQNAHVLLYPEGMVKLSDSASQILKRVDGAASISGIIQDLERAFPGADLRSDVLEFLNVAHQHGWIIISGLSHR